MGVISEIQALLFPDRPAEWDGQWGPRSQSALTAAIHDSKPVAAWPFSVEIVGDDICGAGVITCFGGWGSGISDPQDNGNTASGVNTKTKPVNGVSIAMDGRDFPLLSPEEHAALDGAPIRRLRNSLGLTAWHTPVEVTINGVTFTPPDGIVDLGPGIQATKDRRKPHVLDLSVLAARRVSKLPLVSLANEFEAVGTFRIIGGRLLLPS